MDLSIIIVNYRSEELVLQCLATVYAQTAGIDFEVFVVDNASGDGSESRIPTVYPAIRWVQMGYNAGFARANNAAIRLSKAKAVLLLNPDTLIEGGAITACYRQLESSDYVAGGVQLLNEDRTPQITGSRFMKGGLNYLLPLPFLGHWIKSIGNWIKVAAPGIPEVLAVEEVDWINGAFLMVRRNVLERAGLLDEDFFLYAEEIEWCSRIRRQGRMAVFGKWHVVHLQGASANASFESGGQGYYNLFDRKGLQIMVSNFVRIRKQEGLMWFSVQLFFYLVDIPVFLIGLPFSRRYTSRQFLGYCNNIGRLLRLSLTIMRNKPYFYKVV